MGNTTDHAKSILGAGYLRELNAEAKATRECLENMPADKFDWKPHEKSMELGYLAILIADIPRWIQHIVETAVIDFATYEQFDGKTPDELVAHFDEAMEKARKALAEMTDDDLKKDFILKRDDKVLMTAPFGEMVSSTINHMVHHRGQMTVYLRLNGKIVPSIYGPSADVGGFGNL